MQWKKLWTKDFNLDKDDLYDVKESIWHKQFKSEKIYTSESHNYSVYKIDDSTK